MKLVKMLFRTLSANKKRVAVRCCKDNFRILKERSNWFLVRQRVPVVPTARREDGSLFKGGGAEKLSKHSIREELID